jgi:hypothetical protein
MKLVIRVFAMLVVFAGLTAASISSAPAPAASNHFGITVTGPGPYMPGPPCPTCEPNLQHR